MCQNAMSRSIETEHSSVLIVRRRHTRRNAAHGMSFLEEDDMRAQGTDTTSTKATWPVFMARLQSRQEVAKGTMAFCFEKPAGWTYVAGQFIDMTLIAPPVTDAEGNTRG